MCTMNSSATPRLTSPSSNASRISPSALSRCSSVNLPWPRRFLNARCSLSVRVSNMLGVHGQRLAIAERSRAPRFLPSLGDEFKAVKCGRRRPRAQVVCDLSGDRSALSDACAVAWGAHEFADLGLRGGQIGEGESSLFAHLPRSFDQCGIGDTGEA